MADSSPLPVETQTRSVGPAPTVWTWVLAALPVVLGVAFFAITRWLRPIVGLGNHDVAGIAYNADVILRGGLPYVDTVELKSPGTFFLTAVIFRLFGRSAATLLWTAVGLVAMGSVAAGVAAHGVYLDEPRRDRWVATGLAVGLVWLGMAHFQANYSTWMMGPYAACFACAVWALRSEDRATRAGLHLATGIFATLAYLMKAHGVVLGLIVPSAWAIAHARRWPGATGSAWLWWIAGASLGAVPLLAIYGVAGELRALLEGVLPFAKAATYSQREMEVTWWYVPYRLIMHLDAKFPVHTSTVALAIAGVVARTWVVPDEDGRGAAHRWAALGLGLAFLVLSVMGGGLGGLRYYRHYAPQYLPALAVVCVHPAWWQWLGRWPRRGIVDWLSLAGAVALLVLVGSNAVPYVSRGVQGKLSNGWHPSTDDQEVAAYIKERTLPSETIFVWGWRGWAIYFFSDRHAPTGLYKGLGTITEFNRNGLFRPPPETRDLELDFVPGPHADALLRAFEEDPPAFLVESRPYFPGMRNNPMVQFEPLYELWRRDYVRVRRHRYLHVYEHRAHKAAREAADALPSVHDDPRPE